MLFRLLENFGAGKNAARKIPCKIKMVVERGKRRPGDGSGWRRGFGGGATLWQEKAFHSPYYITYIVRPKVYRERWLI